MVDDVTKEKPLQMVREWVEGRGRVLCAVSNRVDRFDEL